MYHYGSIIHPNDKRETEQAPDQVSSDPRWYLGYTRMGQEIKVEQRLFDIFNGTNDLKIYGVYCPKTRGDARKKQQYMIALYPSYIFVKMNRESEFKKVESVLGRWLVAVTCFGGVKNYSTTNDKFIQRLKKRENDKGQIITGQSEYMVGDKVKIIGGPMKAPSNMAYTAIIDEIKRKVATLWLYRDPQRKPIHGVKLEWLEPV